MGKTLVIVNPRAANGRAGDVRAGVEPLLRAAFPQVDFAVTQEADSVKATIAAAYADGTERVIAIGGDGTNHVVVNAVADLIDREPDAARMAFGTLPVGTGRDWARGLGMPLTDPAAAVRWLAEAVPTPTDIGLLVYDDQREHFLNIGSAGMGNEVAARVNRTVPRRPWSFLQATVTTLLRHQPRQMNVVLDGRAWHDGRAYTLVLANGKIFAHGMKIAPDADVTDGLFDVVLVEGTSRLDILTSLPRVYVGTHLTHPRVRSGRAAQVDVTSGGDLLGVELDGEPFSGHRLSFRVRPRFLNILMHSHP